MAPIVGSIEIARSPEDVFAYIDQLDRHGEWQDEIVSVRLVTDGPTHKGSRAAETRKMPFGGPRESTYEVTEHDPPRTSSFRGIDGAVRPVGVVTVEPAGSGARVTIDLDFEGHGMGKLFVPMARSQARKAVPKSQQRLKERLESGA